jgi:hypothetical protein
MALLATSVAMPRPVQADLLNFKPSSQDQIRLGEEAAAQIERKYRVVHDGRERLV